MPIRPKELSFKKTWGSIGLCLPSIFIFGKIYSWVAGECLSLLKGRSSNSSGLAFPQLLFYPYSHYSLRSDCTSPGDPFCLQEKFSPRLFFDWLFLAGNECPDFCYWPFGSTLLFHRSGLATRFGLRWSSQFCLAFGVSRHFDERYSLSHVTDYPARSFERRLYSLRSK